MTQEVLSAAFALCHCGLSVLPIKADGSKAPALLSWHGYQSAIADEATLKQWFERTGHGVGIICGRVSGGLEVIDIENQQSAKQWQSRVTEAGGQDIFNKLVVVKTPRGFHCYYRCAQPAGSMDLARRALTEEEKRQYPRRRFMKLIETRGEGAYVIAPGSPTGCHPLGLTYMLTRGSFTEIPDLTGEERDLLLDCARSLNEYHADRAYVEPAPSEQKSKSESAGDRPGDIFNSRATWAEILEPQGWKRSTAGPGRWIRPGGTRDSACEILSGEKLWVFSSSVSQLPFEQALSKYAVYTLLNCNGNFSQSTLQLAKAGYCKPQPAPAGKDPKQKTPGVPPRSKSVPNEQPEPEVFALRTVSGPELLSKNFEPPRWAIEDLLPEGLTIFAGAPKLGKSWMALQIALGCSLGKKVLGDYWADKGEVLYLALEDSFRRLQQRLNTIAEEEEITPNLLLCTELPGMAEGGVVALEKWLQEHPDCRLVIIDTLARFMPPAERGVNAYQADYAVVSRLQKLALKYHIALFVVHHVRKSKSGSDVFDEISGSSGITGPADANWVLKRARTETVGTLTITGRDIEELQLSAEFDKASCRWSLQGDVRQGVRRDLLVKLAARFGGEAFTNAAARGPLGVSLAHAKRIVGGLVSDGYVTRLNELAGRAFQFRLTDKLATVCLAGGGDEL